MTVSIAMITYNHENYIHDAIKGIMMQKTSFEYELIIGEDCSNDGTRAICEAYAIKYGNIIKLLPSEKNFGIMPNFVRTIKACDGKYIAICEGDDFWTDPHKLQKQVDFLEQNPEYVISFHASKTLNMDTGIVTSPKYDCSNGFRTFTTKDVILHGGGFMPTNSIVFRSEFIQNIPEWFINAPTGDFPLSLLLSSKGKVAYFDEFMSVYRSGTIGSWSKRMDNIYRQRELNEATEKMLLSFNRYTENKHLTAILHKIIKNRMNLAYCYLRYIYSKFILS